MRPVNRGTVPKRMMSTGSASGFKIKTFLLTTYRQMHCLGGWGEYFWFDVELV